MTTFDDGLEAAVARATAIQTEMITNSDRITVRLLTCDDHTHWCATGYGFTATAITTADVLLTGRAIREPYRTGIELVDPDGNVVASDFRF